MIHPIPTDRSNTIIPPLSSVSAHNGIVSCITTSSSINGHFFVASGGSDYSLILYSLTSKSINVHKRISNAHEGIITSILFGSGMATGVLYSAGMDNCIKIWNCVSLEHIGNLCHHSKKVVALTQSSDGRFLISAGADRVVLVYDLTKNYRLILKLETRDEPTSLSFHQPMIVVGLKSGMCQCWNIPI